MSAQRIDDTVMENIEILAKLSMSEEEMLANAPVKKEGQYQVPKTV